MQITKEYLERRKAELKIQQDQHIAGANICSGAIHEIEQQLAVLAVPDPKPNKGKKP